MPPLTLEARVAALEQQVAELQHALTTGTGVKDWRRTIGMFTGDEAMKQIFDEALKIRERDRERARRRYAKSRRSKNRPR